MPFFIVLSCLCGTFLYAFRQERTLFVSPLPEIASNPIYRALDLNIGTDRPLPPQGFLSGSNYHIFWFLVISDTQNCWYNTGRKALFNQFLNETFKTIKPVFIWNTGDLVDSDYEDFMLRNSGQRDDEWWTYRNLLNINQMNETVYFDIIGNHDTYRDPGTTHYLNYSISGEYFHSTQFAVRLLFPWGNYSFYGLPVPQDYGLEYPFSLGGVMNQTELDWLEASLEAQQDDNLTFTFGHQPLFETVSGFSSRGNTFLGLLNGYGVDFYACGHGHEWSYQDVYGLPSFETTQFKKDGGGYRIVAVDNDVISTSEQSVSENPYPVGIITSPIDDQLAIGDYDQAKSINVDVVRALAWDPDGISTVEWRADGVATWEAMVNIDGPLWSGPLSSDLKDGQTHTIEVKIRNTIGGESIEVIQFSTTPPFHFGWAQGIFLINFGFFGLIVVLPIAKIIRGKRNPDKYGKAPKSIVDPIQRRTLLIKLALLVLAPLTIGLMMADSITFVFSFFVIGTFGLVYVDTLAIFFGVLLAVCIMVPMLFLSPRRATGMLKSLFFSLALEIFLFIFYILHFPTVAWIAPGIYAIIASDILLAKRAIHLRKTR